MERDYPYMYARISARRKKLLDQQNYENMLKMGPNEITRKLGELEYKKDIDYLGTRHDGIELAELALARNVSRSMKELKEMAPSKIEPKISAYLRRYDVQNLKRLLRWKKSGENQELETMIMPAGSFSKKKIKQISEKSFEEIKEEIEFSESSVDYQKYIEQAEDLKEVERMLDKAYYDDLKAVAENCPNNWLKRFVSEEIKYENLKIALRLKRYGKDEEEIQEWLINGEISKETEKVLQAENFETAIQELNSLKVFNKAEEATFEEIEHGIEVERLQNSLQKIHIDPLGLTSILGYIVAKVAEVKNLRMLLRAKETGIQNPETIRKNLVTA